MPRYLAPINEYGYHASITGYLPPHEAEGLTEYTGQNLPCWPDGAPLTEQELADIEAQKEQARLQAIYQSLQPQAMELVQYMAAAAIEYGVNIDPAHLEGATFADLYSSMYKVIPDEMYERMRVIYENEVIAYHYEGNGKLAADEFPSIVAMAVEELSQ